MAFHTMAILQAYQADILKETDEGEGLTCEAVKELRRATNLALHATKHTASAVGRTMAGLVAVEHHLWLNLTEICEKRRSSYWTPLSHSQVCLERWSTQWSTNSELLRCNRLPLSSLCLGGVVNLPLLPPCPGTALRTEKRPLEGVMSRDIPRLARSGELVAVRFSIFSPRQRPVEALT